MAIHKFLLPLVVIGIAAGAGLAWLLLAGSPDASKEVAAGSDMPMYRAGPFHVGVEVDPASPEVGDNRLTVVVQDTGGEPVSDASIRAAAEMAAMGAMPAMRAPAELEEIAPGRYAGEFNLQMSGAWPLSVSIEKTGLGQARLGFDLATGRAGLDIRSGGAPVDASGMSAASESDPAPADGGGITIDSRRRQLIGVETGIATHRDLVKTIRAVGRVTYDERHISKVALKFDAWIGDLEADYVGAPIERGQMLFTVYSPELLAAQQEYLLTLERLARRGPGDSLLAAARQRLMLWDVSEAQVAALERRGEPFEYLPIFSPVSGTLVEKNIEAGGAVKSGETLLRIADLSQVWVDAEVYEADLGLVEAGMQATVRLPYLPGKEYAAKVDYVYPYLEGDSRTGRIRLSLDNPDGVLKPDMYAEVVLEADLGRWLAVPEEAVLVAGENRIVFVDRGEGRLEPVRVTTGRTAQGYVHILDGLELGDEVVTSGNFLIAAETKLEAGLEQW
ncbi:MAG: efflux RND transporter periplasmic adaptor subunit, partial [Gammaproteobacteria bacterium]|nr:efflux RND transporter periplasmic adaptor subunit [Gammaproteobacteria bacterium]